MKQCIYCKKTDVPFNEEHVIPDSIGCPTGLVLNDAVCESCNGKLSVLDNGVIQFFDVPRWMYEIRNKKGKIPKISSIRNIATDDKGEDGEKRMVINGGPSSTAIEGLSSPLAGTKKGSTSIQPSIEIMGKGIKIGFQKPLHTDRTFIRGIYKIGFEILCWLKGKELVLTPFYDEYRDFIWKNIGDMELFYEATSDGKIENRFIQAQVFQNETYLVEFRLINMVFYVNLTMDQEPYDYMFRHMVENKAHRMKYVKTIGQNIEYH